MFYSIINKNTLLAIIYKFKSQKKIYCISFMQLYEIENIVHIIISIKIFFGFDA